LVDTFMLTAPDAVSATKQLVHDLPLRSLDADAAGSDDHQSGTVDGHGNGGGLSTDPAAGGTAADAISTLASSAAVPGARLPEWVVAGNPPTGVAPA